VLTSRAAHTTVRLPCVGLPAAIRTTWSTGLPHGGTKFVVRFVLARNNRSEIPPHLLEEAAKHKDVVFVDTLDAYLNLAAKVGLYFKWVVDTCTGNPLALKTDEDSFIHLPRLAAAMAGVPRERLFWGRMVKGMPARKNGRPLKDNYQNMHVWPDYASGAGYAVSFDVAKAIAYPVVPLLYHEAEDQHVGVALFGYNVTQKDDRRFSPWGECDEETILLHYQRHPEILKRRFRRAVAKISICGVQLKDDEICQKADPNKVATWMCPEGTKITDVLGATYGRVYSSGKAGSCSEGVEGMEPLEWCHAPNTAKVIGDKCIGQNSCELKAEHKQFGKDPCKGERKHLVAVFRCK